MAATIITVSEIGNPNTNIAIKINDGHPVPTKIITDVIKSFRTWPRDSGHIFVWTNDNGQEMSIIVSETSIGWVMSEMPIGITEDRFRIDAPCEVTFVAEV